ncbi:MAG TPA: hypothetical protein VFP36_04890 [Usitatibacter sp.]|nr:hypothetical protein [Usitatibacter sp.]
MALFERFKSQAGTPVPTTGEIIPTSTPMPETTPAWKAQANAVIDRAAQVYNRNPKLIAGLGLIAAAGLLVGLKRGRISFK